MANPHRIEQLAQKLDTLCKASSFISSLTSIESYDMTDAEINNLDMQIKLMEEMAVTLNDICFEIRSATWQGRLILNIAKSMRGLTDEGDEDDDKDS